MRNVKTAFLAALAILALSASAGAAEPSTTAMTVEKIHCMSCARKMADKLYAVAGVASVSADVKSARLTIAPKAGEAPSPRQLWGAIEKVGYKPMRLEGPGGKYTARQSA